MTKTSQKPESESSQALQRHRRFLEDQEKMKTRIPWLRKSWTSKPIREERLYSEELEKFRDKENKKLVAEKTPWTSESDRKLYCSFFIRRLARLTTRSSRVNTNMLMKFGKYPPYACETIPLTSPLFQEYLDCFCNDWTVAFYVPCNKIDFQ